MGIVTLSFFIMRFPLLLPVFFLTILTLTSCQKSIEFQKEDVQPEAIEVQMNAIEQRRQMEADKNDTVETTQSSSTNDVVMDDQDDANQEYTQGTYTAYTEGVIGNGETSVLFFHATWCPACKQNNTNLEEWYAADTFPRSVYKIDYDTSIDLRKQFGVTGQDTFIVIDGNGEEQQRVSFPSEEALRALLG